MTLIVGLLAMAALIFFVGRQLKAAGSELAAKIRELENKRYVRVNSSAKWEPETYQLYKEGNHIQLVIIGTEQTIIYTYSKDGEQMRVNYENHTPFFNRELSRKLD